MKEQPEEDEVIISGKVRKVGRRRYESFGLISTTIQTRFVTTTYNHEHCGGWRVWFRAPASLSSV